jgi:hypothetical protein
LKNRNEQDAHTLYFVLSALHRMAIGFASFVGIGLLFGGVNMKKAIKNTNGNGEA